MPVLWIEHGKQPGPTVGSLQYLNQFAAGDRFLRDELVDLKNARARAREIHAAEHIAAYAVTAVKREIDIVPAPSSPT
jgi:hypothetical protein